MGQPITWQNVNGPSLAQASQPLNAASNSFNNAFSQLGDVLKENQTMQDQNWQTQKSNNTTDFMNNLYAKYTKPEDLQAAIQTGAVAKDLAGYGHMIDADKVRGAAEAHLAQLQQQGLQNITYGHATTDEAQAAQINDLKIRLNSPDAAVRSQAMKDLLVTAPHLRTGADVMQSGVLANHQFDQWGQQAALNKSTVSHLDAETLAVPIQAAAAAESAHAATINARTGQVNANTSQQQFALSKEDHQRELEGKAAQEYQAALGMDASTPQGLSTISEALSKTIKDPADLTSRMQAVQEFISEHPGKVSTGAAIAFAQNMNSTHALIPNIIQRGLAYLGDDKFVDSDANKSQLGSAAAMQARALQNIKTLRTSVQTGTANNFGMPGPIGFDGAPSTGGAAPAGVPAPSGKPQNYPPGFNPPNNGLADPNDRLAIIQKEYADEVARAPTAPGRAANIASLTNELRRLGATPGGSLSTQPPAAGAPNGGLTSGPGEAPAYDMAHMTPAQIAAAGLKVPSVVSNTLYGNAPAPIPAALAPNSPPEDKVAADIAQIRAHMLPGQAESLGTVVPQKSDKAFKDMTPTERLADQAARTPKLAANERADALAETLARAQKISALQSDLSAVQAAVKAGVPIVPGREQMLINQLRMLSPGK